MLTNLAWDSSYVTYCSQECDVKKCVSRVRSIHLEGIICWHSLEIYILDHVIGLKSYIIVMTMKFKA